MQDILGRKLCNGDIVVVCPCSSNIMKLGIFDNNYIIVELNNGTYRTTYKQIFKIVNPTDKEFAVKERIENIIKEKERVKKEKNKSKYIPIEDMEIGGIYENEKGIKYIYFGYNSVTVSIKEKHDNKFRLYNGDSNDSSKKQNVGYCYLLTPQYEYNSLHLNEDYYLNTVSSKIIGFKVNKKYKHNFEVCVHPKKLIKKNICQLPIELPFELTKQMDVVNLNRYIKVLLEEIKNERTESV